MTLTLRRGEPEAEDAPLPGMLGEHPLMKEVYRLVRRVAPTELPVLVLGETGTGKELVARAIHDLSGRSGRFVALNVCAVADSLFESALFGHVKGAFTGALADAPGYLLEADGGTVFLDEIGSLGLLNQAKLLRAIETREFRPAGGRLDRRSDFRVLVATNADLRELVREGRFRRDLFERLQGVVIALPPLRERAQDIPLLASWFLGQLGDGHLPLSQQAAEALAGYDWPGNVRELRNAVRRAARLVEGRAITATEVAALLEENDPGAGPVAVRALARRRMLEVLEDSGWDTAATARVLGVHRGTVYRRMQRLGIAPPLRRHFHLFALIRSHSRESARTGANK
jgi:DNA-binding NtrC family response regulator